MDILVISSYPEKDKVHGTKTVGVASYAKNTLKSIVKVDKSIKAEVYAEVFETPEIYDESDNIKVNRIWKRNSFISILNLYNKIKKSNHNTTIVQFEMYMIGRLPYSSFFLFILFLLKYFSRKKIIIVVHQVVGDLNAFEKNPLKRVLFNFLKSFFYRFLLISSNKVVVFEGALKERLWNHKKVLVIPHAVESMKLISMDHAKKELKLDVKKKYILYFGFLSFYKGIDRLIDNWPDIKNVELIIAGGGNPNYKEDHEYQSYIDILYNKANAKGIKITGFLKESDISRYYSAADAVILPYRTFMSSSGPLSIAFSYNKPVLMSSELFEYIKTDDFSKCMKSSLLKKEDMFVPIDKSSLEKSLNNLFVDYEKYVKFSSLINSLRSWDNIAMEYIKVLKKGVL